MKLPVMSHCYTHTCVHCVQHHSLRSTALSSLFKDSSTCTSGRWNQREERRGLWKRTNLSSKSTRAHARAHAHTHKHIHAHARTHSNTHLSSFSSICRQIWCFTTFYIFSLFSKLEKWLLVQSQPQLRILDQTIWKQT